MFWLILDGRKSFPINHGPTTPETFLQVRKVLSEGDKVTHLDAVTFHNMIQDAAKVCQNFMSRDPTELHFTIVALSAAAT